MRDVAVRSDGARRRQRQVVEITVDSGAAEVVAAPRFAADYAPKPSAGSKAGVKYRTASEKRTAMKTEGVKGHDVSSGRRHEAVGLRRTTHEQRTNNRAE